MAQAELAPAPTAEIAVWKQWSGALCAFALAVVFLVAGFWKLSDPLGTSARMVQALIPGKLALAVALLAGITEAFAGVLMVVPRWRRWGSWLCGLMLLAFMVYIGVNYSALAGEDCSCFPWLKRAVGPEFFISDALMLVAAVAAGFWSRPSESERQALLVLAAIAVFAGAVYGMTLARQTGIEAPRQLSVDGKAFELHQGRVFLYFFDPECSHCDAAARALKAHRWRGVRVVAVSTANPQWGAQFLSATGLKAGLSSDVEKLRAVFKFTDPPYGVALERGRQQAEFTFFDKVEPATGLKRLGWIE
jgi:uncharacterized membrane protein YphA (DoxX/SURF4 family)